MASSLIERVGERGARPGDPFVVGALALVGLGLAGWVFLACQRVSASWSRLEATRSTKALNPGPDEGPIRSQ